MFQNLASRLSGIFDKLRHRGVLTEDDVNATLREIRQALLEADVALPAVKQFVEQIREKAIGQDVVRSITPGQMVVKIVHDHLVDFLGREVVELNLSTQPPAVLFMVGLQGSGKTTTTAKLARHLTTKLQKRVLMASLDVYRPAAQQQLAVLGDQLKIDTLPIHEGELPLTIAQRALEVARRQAYDVLLLDSAGRLHIDETLMEEVIAIKRITSPIETLLVADSMMGQDALTVAKTFHEQVGLTGIVLTRLDGDARGGAALSMLAVTGQPIKFAGVGEKLDQLEVFNPQRIANRILGMGDIVGLVERATEVVSQEDAAKMATKMQKGQFTLDDMAQHLEQMLKMGGMGSLMNLLPGMGAMKDKMVDAGLNDGYIRHQIAMIRSMTRQERRDPRILNGSRRRRIAAGSGRGVPDVNRLLKQYLQMQQAVKKMGKMGGTKGLLRQGLFNGLKNLVGR
jgi:signal recognition particle subunit SRP54